MKTEIVETLSGKSITRLIPENDADEAKLRKMGNAGEVDTNESMGDEFADLGHKPGEAGGP